MESINIMIAVLTLLGGYFGIPKLIEAGYQQRQRTRIRIKAEKLAKEIFAQREKKSIRYDPLYDEVKELLWKAKDTIKNKEFLQRQLNEIIRKLYDSRMDEDIQELRAKYQDFFEFNEESWANIAIANLNLYRLDGMNEYRQYSLEACKESIKRRANYGTPKAVMLIIYMIDHERNKEIFKEEIRGMLNEIVSGDDTMVSFDTYDYLNRTQIIPEWKKYIDHLFNIYPEEMAVMKSRYEKYISIRNGITNF